MKGIDKEEEVDQQECEFLPKIGKATFTVVEDNSKHLEEKRYNTVE